MTHEHCGAQHYDGHDQIQFAVAIYVRKKENITRSMRTQTGPRRQLDTFG